MLLAAAPIFAQDLAWYEAIRTGNLATVQQFLDDGADPNQRVDTPGSPTAPLVLAVVDREEDIALLLLARGAKVAVADEVDVVTEAAAKGLPRLLELLLRQDPALFSEPVGGIRPYGLPQSASHGHFEVVDLLLRLSVEFGQPFASDELGEAANIAIVHGFDDIGRRVIEFTRIPYFGSLSVAAAVSSPGMVRYLLDLGADPGERYHREGLVLVTPLDLALQRYVEARSPADQYVTRLVVHELLSSSAGEVGPGGVDLGHDGRRELAALATLDSHRALTEAARLGYYDVVSSLLGQGASTASPEFRAAMVVAARVALLSGHDDIARLLLQSGTNPNGGLLHAAARRSSPGMVRYLLSLGANPMERFGLRVPMEYWLERVEADNDHSAPSVLHELIVGGAEPCWLADHSDTIGLAGFVLRNSASHCWPDVSAPGAESAE